MRLQSKRALITGGASGIGRAICEVFAKEGASIVIGDMDKVGGQETVELVKALGAQVSFIHTDVSNESDVQNLVSETVSELGGIDILVNNAAAFVFGKVEDVSRSDWEKVLGVNVIGPAQMVRYALPYLKLSQAGAIVNMASTASLMAEPTMVPYGSSKGALFQLTKCLAMDLAPDGIRVNSICPGAIYTAATEKHLAFTGFDRDKFLAQCADESLMKRMGEPEEVAFAALFLASDEASFITGANIVLDGGAIV